MLDGPERNVSYTALSRILPDILLREVDSDEERSTYTWWCGCVAIRPVDLDVCDVQWCSTHIAYSGLLN